MMNRAGYVRSRKSMRLFLSSIQEAKSGCQIAHSQEGREEHAARELLLARFGIRQTEWREEEASWNRASL